MKRKLPEGLTVEYGHLRNYDNDGNLLAKGGITTARILRGEDVVAYATARCSEVDNFNKHLGRTISLGRALAKLDGTTEHRKLEQEAREAALFLETKTPVSV